MIGEVFSKLQHSRSTIAALLYLSPKQSFKPPKNYGVESTSTGSRTAQLPFSTSSEKQWPAALWSPPSKKYENKLPWIPVLEQDNQLKPWDPTYVIQLPPQRTLKYRNSFLSSCNPSSGFNVIENWPHLIASPLVQIFSVSVHTDFDAEQPCEIYGSIGAMDEKGATYSLYDRCPGESEAIMKYGNLTLTGPEGRAISCSGASTTTTMDLYLKDGIRGIEIIKGKYILHSKTEENEDSWDKLLKGIVHGEHGFACVYYSIFRCAVFAHVKIEIFSKYDTSCPYVDVYGTIVAGYVKFKPNSSSDEMKHMKRVVFNQTSDQSVRMMVGSPVRLSSCVVAVPAYSSLKVEADLWDSRGQFVSGSTEIFARDFALQKKIIYGKGGIMVVEAHWDQAYRWIGKQRCCPQVAVSKVIGDSKGGEPLKKAMIVRDRQFPSASSPLGSLRSFASLPCSFKGRQMVEVFSIFVAGVNDEVSALCGDIQCRYGGKFSMFSIYNRDLSDPEMLAANKGIASIECHKVIAREMFMIDLSLKDPVGDLEISKGWLSWGYDPTSIPFIASKRVCSVVRGAHGYAAVHYIVFESACKAMVEIIFLLNKPAADVPAHSIYGCICARYSGHDYTSSYEKKYYQSRLLEKPEMESVQLTTQSKIPLSRSVVAVPTDSTLIIVADLRALCSCNLKEEVLCGSTEFGIDLSSSTNKEIQGEYFNIQVNVKFTEY